MSSNQPGQMAAMMGNLLAAITGGRPFLDEIKQLYDAMKDAETRIASLEADLEAMTSLARELAEALLGLRRVCNVCGSESGHWLEPDDPYIELTVLCDACQAKNGYESNMDLLKGVDLEPLLSKARAAGLEV